MFKWWFKPIEEQVQEHEAEEDALYSTTWRNRAIFGIIMTVVLISIILALIIVVIVFNPLWYVSILFCLFAAVIFYYVAKVGIQYTRYNLFRYRKAMKRERKKQEEFLKTYKYLKKDNEQEKDQSASHTGLAADTIHEEPENKQ